MRHSCHKYNFSRPTEIAFLLAFRLRKFDCAAFHRLTHRLYLIAIFHWTFFINQIAIVPHFPIVSWRDWPFHQFAPSFPGRRISYERGVWDSIVLLWLHPDGYLLSGHWLRYFSAVAQSEVTLSSSSVWWCVGGMHGSLWTCLEEERWLSPVQRFIQVWA